MAKSKINKAQRKRIGWDKYFMNIAKEVSSRSTCDRNRVGASLSEIKQSYLPVTMEVFEECPIAMMSVMT